MKTRFDINPMNRLYHIQNIEVIASGMEKQLELFAEKNGANEVIEQKKEQLIALKEAQVFISKIYSELEKERQAHLNLKVKNTHAELVIDILKKGIEDWERKYNGLINFK
jgi:hypothetical protein